MAGADAGGKTVPLADQEPVGGDAQGGVMVKSAPTPSFIVAQPQLLLEFLVVTLDDPAVLGNLYQRLPWSLLRQRGQPVFRWFGFFLGPFDQEPFFRAWHSPLFVAVSRTHPDGGKTGAQSLLTAWTPSDVLPSRRRQPEGQLLHRNRLVVRVALQALGCRSTAGLSRWGRQGLLPGLPDSCRRLDAYHIGQSELGDGGTKGRAVSIAGVCQHYSYGNLLLYRLADLLQCNLWLGLKLHPFRNPGLLAPLRILAPHLR